MVLVGLVGLLLSIWVSRAKRQRDVIVGILDSGGWVYFGEDYVPTTIRDRGLSCHLFQSVKLVTLRPTSRHTADAQLRLVAQLPAIEELTIWPGQAGNTLDLRAAGGITDRGIETIVKHLPHLKYLGATAANCSDHGLRRLEEGLLSADHIHVKLRDETRPDLLV
ncbi:MAG: hypothetical protein Aurels2KO_34030 [Aureliella sp.]